MRQGGLKSCSQSPDEGEPYGEHDKKRDGDLTVLSVSLVNVRKVPVSSLSSHRSDGFMFVRVHHHVCVTLLRV